MKTVRANTFETNSSSCHAVVLMDASIFDDKDNWPTKFIIKWEDEGTGGDDTSTGVILSGDEAVNYVMDLIKEETECIPMAIVEKALEAFYKAKLDQEFRNEHPELSDDCWDILVTALHGNCIEKDEMQYFSAIRRGDTVAVCFEQMC